MSKITKKAIKEIKRSTNNKLTKKACNVLLEKGTAEDIEIYINDLLYCGCQSGVEGSLIYYSDTIAFYKKYQTEIKELLKEALEETGFKSPEELFGEKWDSDDIFAEDTNNQNLLAWFGFEETVRKIAYELGMDV